MSVQKLALIAVKVVTKFKIRRSAPLTVLLQFVYKLQYYIQYTSFKKFHSHLFPSNAASYIVSHATMEE